MKHRMRRIFASFLSLILVLHTIGAPVLADENPPPFENYLNSDTSTSSGEPEVSSSEPEVSSSKPEVSSSEPEVSSSEPEVSSSEPEVSSSEPESSSSGPESSSSESEASSSEPESSSSEPESSSSEPESSSSEPQTSIVVTSFAPLSKEQMRILVDVGTAFEDIALPETLYATDADQNELVIGAVRWVCEGYNAQEVPGTVFTAHAVLGQDYQLAEGISTPSIELVLSGSAMRSINDRIIIEGVIYKEIDPDNVQLIGYNDEFNGSLVVPKEVAREDGRVFKVVSVEANAFENCATLESITIQGNPKIGDYAFAGSKAASVNFGTELNSIGSYAFYKCSALKGVTIPATLQSTGSNLFASSGLETVLFEDGVKTISSSMFYQCDSLKNVTIPASITSIGVSVFSYSGLESVTFEEGIQSIDRFVFDQSTKLKEVKFPSTLTSIGENSFAGCVALTKLEFPEKLTRIRENAFLYCSSLTDVSFKEGLTELGAYSFQNCSSLANFTLPASLRSIGVYAFGGTTALKSVTIPGGVSEFRLAFIASGLESVTIEDGIETISSGAFQDCASLTAVTLPTTLKTIDSNAFFQCVALPQIRIPATVTKIDYSAFHGCGALQAIDLPDGLTGLGSGAFLNCSKLTEIEIPAGVSVIPSQIFYGCKALSRVTFSTGSKVQHISDQAFNGCSALKGIVLPETLTHIYGEAFQNCTALDSILIPETVVQIDFRAFLNAGLTTITIPQKMKHFSYSAFEGCGSLTEAVIEGSGVFFSKNTFGNCPKLNKITIKGKPSAVDKEAFMNSNATLVIHVPDIETAVMVRDSGFDPARIKIDGTDSGLAPSNFIEGDAAYTVIDTTAGSEKVALTSMANKTVTSFTVPETVTNSGIIYSVTQIGNNAFNGCNQMSAVSMSDSILEVGISAFYNCTSLSSVTLSKGLTRIMDNTFQGCRALTSITIPDGITEIREYAFWDCRALKNIELPDSLTTIGEDIFLLCISLEKIELPDGITEIPKRSFESCSNLTEVKFPAELRRIGQEVFNNCIKLSDVSLPENLTYIGYKAFFSCESIEQLVVPGKVTIIDENAFSACISLSSVSLSESLTAIYEYAFSGCISLQTIEIPKNVTRLGRYAFAGCIKLTSAVISGNIEINSYYNHYGYPYINNYIFDGCTSLSEVTFSENRNATIPGYMFHGCSALEKVILSGSVTEIGDGAFNGCAALKTVKGSDTLSVIRPNAFSDCTALTDVSLPSVGYVESSAFSGCTKLQRITLPDNINTIRSQAFAGCTDLEWAKIGSGLQKIERGAFPTTTQLISNDSRVQLLLVEYLNQDEGNRPMSEWDGKTNILPGAIVAVNQDIIVDGYITMGKDSELTIYENVTVKGTLVISGRVIMKSGGVITVAQGGKVVDEFGNSLPINYLITLPLSTKYGSVKSDKPFYLAGDTVTLTVSPAAGCRLKPNSLKYGETLLTVNADGESSFIMPADPVAISAEFEEALRVESASDSVMAGQSIQLSAVFPPDVNTQGAVYTWTVNAGLNLGTLTDQNTATATLHAGNVSDDAELLVTVTVKLDGITMTANKTILIKSIKSISIDERPTAAFRPNETLQLTASLDQKPAPAGSVKWTSSNPSVAAVSENGLVTFKGAGTANVTASTVTAPASSAGVALSVVLDVTGNLTFQGGGKASYKAIDIQKDKKPLRTIYTDMNGEFSLLALEAGVYDLISNPNTPGYDTLSKTITIPQGGSNSIWKLEYLKCDVGSVSFTFKDTSGAPISGVRAALNCERPYQAAVAYSADDGTGRFDNLSYSPAGTAFTLTYSTNDGGFDSKEITLKSGEATQDILFTLPHTSTVTGRVIDANGTGISGLYVQVGNRNAYTNDTGTYSIRGKIKTGSYPVQIGSWEKFFPTAENPNVQITDGGTVTVPDIVVTMGIGVSGKVLLDGRTDNFKKAFVSLTNEKGAVIASGYASGDGGFGFDGAIKQTGSYRLSVGQIYNKTGWFALEYETEPVPFVVSSMSQERIILDLTAKSKLKTSEIFRGEGNSMTSNTALAQADGKIELMVKYKNNSAQAVTATFETSLANARLDPAFNNTEYAKTTHIVTVNAGQSGSFIIKTLADSGKITTVSAETKVTINGSTFDFGRLSVDVANVTLSAQSASVGVGQSFSVYGEAAKNSTVMVYGPGSKLLGAVKLGDAGRWFSLELKGFDKEGSYQIYATADMGSEIAWSDMVTIDVSSSPVKLSKVSVDQLSYDDLPINARVGVRAFSHMVDSSLVPEPLSVRTLFDGDDRISSVVYHFFENNYTAQKGADGRWYANLDGWRGTGTKQLTATVTADGRKLEFTIAEVTVLVDPSGHITDADTGKSLPGVLVSCYEKQSDGSFALWDSAPHLQAANPWKTGANGSYGWHVPKGTYQIYVEKDGYESADSTQIKNYEEGINIPPPALDVNFAMIPTIPMQLAGLKSANGEITAWFSRYVSSADVTLRNENGETIPCDVRADADAFVITASGLVDGASYTVELSNVAPKSGSSSKYGLKFASGTVVFSARKLPVSSGGSGDSGGSSGGEFASLFPSFKIEPADIRKAPRVNGCAVINLAGANPKTSGSKLAKALETLKSGEKLALRSMDKKQIIYQFTIDPKTLTTLPKTISFGVSPDHKWTRSLFEKYYTNQFAVISCKQEGSFGFKAELAVKADVSKLNAKTLTAYSYDRKSNTYNRLAAVPYVDEAGYLHLSLQSGGIVVLTDSELVKK